MSKAKHKKGEYDMVREREVLIHIGVCVWEGNVFLL